MGNVDVDNGTKRKTSFQLEALENYYSEDHYPKQNAMEEYAEFLKLTYKQVRGWFVEKRRRDKRNKGVLSLSKKDVKDNTRTRCSVAKGPFGMILKRDSPSQKLKTRLSSKCSRSQLQKFDRKDGSKSRLSNHRIMREDKHASSRKLKDPIVGSKNSKKKRKLTCCQDLFPPDYILKKIFRKDGPPLGSEFDPLPSGSVHNLTDTNISRPTCTANQRETKRRKVSKLPTLDSAACKKKCCPETKHGMGKGLMTAWRATNPHAGAFPTGVGISGREATDTRVKTLSTTREPSQQRTKKSVHQKLAEKQRNLVNKVLHERKRVNKNTKIGSKKDEYPKKLTQEECKLAIGGLKSYKCPNALETLVDDEELELRELQSGPNPLTCSADHALTGMHSCSLCKDLLPRFPPHSVKMKQPFHMQPWDSSAELVKKLFKVFRFLYTHAVTVDMCPFTLDEFAQSFHDKDSLLLGKIHVALLKLLLSDVEMELSNGAFSRASKDYMFLGFLHSVKRQEVVLNLWNRSLNPLTWTEILRQVMIAAGFGSKQTTLRKELLNKEGNRMVKYGLYPGTLKGELFSILSEQGNRGLKVSELANASQIVDLNLAETSGELEIQICSTLASDITLFEKISPSAYRLRNNPLIGKDMDDSQSDSEDSGSVDDDSGESSGDDSELDSATSLSIVKFMGHRKRKNNMLIEDSEIDESHSGEVWVLGLMESEYSDLSIEEKLNALVALVDLTSAGFSLRMEDPLRVIVEGTPTFQHTGGGKIKRSSIPRNIPKQLPLYSPVDSSSIISNSSSIILKTSKQEKFSKRNGFGGSNGPKSKGTETTEEPEMDCHPLQSVHLGSDRRYNSYWLFLGPCNAKDPGHRRVYFESSEDGHWEVIDTAEALCGLLSVLDSRGTREARLFASLEKREVSLCQSMSSVATIDNDTMQSHSDVSGSDVISGEGSSPISDIDNNLSFTETINDSLSSSGAIILQNGKKRAEQKQKWVRLQAFDAWIWSSFYSNLNAVKHGKRSYLDSLARCESCHDLYWRDEKHCKVCHITFEIDFDLEEKYAIHAATCKEKESNMFPKHKVLSSQLQSIKAAIHAIEAVMPHGALLGAWTMATHKLWVKRLRRTSSIPEFFQVLTDFIGAINEDWLSQCNFELGCGTALDEIIISFPTMPQTTSAVALWLVKLDTVIAPYLEKVHTEPQRSTRQKGRSALS